MSERNYGRPKSAAAKSYSSAFLSRELEEISSSNKLGDENLEIQHWSAQYFALFYSRYRSHLIRHASKVLRDHDTAEEVVQDAFLYLLTSLPELESELDVLKFLKWKTRMLALDVVRAQQRRGITLDLPDDVASDGFDPSAPLLRADDAALVSLALSKLDPRYREAILQSVDSKQSTAETAQKFGLSENGYRQLLFRARKAFREAFIGSASSEGKSISELLSIAARKAAKSQVTPVLVVVLIFAAGLSTSLWQQPLMESPVATVRADGANTAPEDNIEPKSQPSITESIGDPENTEIIGAPLAGPLEGESWVFEPNENVESPRGTPSREPAEARVNAKGSSSENAANDEPGASRARELRENARIALTGNLAIEGLTELQTYTPRLEETSETRLLTTSLTEGLGVSIGLSQMSDQTTLDFLVLTINDPLTQNEFLVIPTNTYQAFEQGGGTSVLRIWATDFLAGDTGGKYENVAFDVEFPNQTFIEIAIEIQDDLSRSKISFRFLDSEDI